MEHVQLLSRNLRKVKQLYNKLLLRELAAHDLDQHYEALLILAEQDKPITQNMLAELLQMDKSRIVSIVYALGKKKLIISKTNPADRREHYISLSAKARAAIPVIESVIRKVNELANAGLTDEKLSTFFEVSAMMHQNLLQNTSVETILVNSK
jgi:DNA-binding MarR family transcriptional regulator